MYKKASKTRSNKPQNDTSSLEVRILEAREKIFSKDKSTAFNGLHEFRSLLSEPNYPFEEDGNDEYFMSKIIQFLDKKEELETQIESSAILSQICSADKHICIILNKSETILNLIAALDLENQVLLENVLSTINSLLTEANKSHRWKSTKEIYLQSDCLKKICTIFQKHPIPPIKKNIVTFLFNIVKYKPNPSWEQIKPVMPILQEAIQGLGSGETLVQALECIQYLVTSEDGNIQRIIDLGFVPCLVQHLYNADEKICFPTLRAFGNLIAGDDEQAEEVLSHPNFLIRLFELISSPNKKIQKEASWVISNVAAGSVSQKIQIINGPNYMNILKNLLSHEDEDIFREVTWIYTNLLCSDSSELVNNLIENYDYLECLSIMFNEKGRRNHISQLALEALNKILDHGKELPIQKIVDLIQEDFAEKIQKISKDVECQEHVDKINEKLKDLGFNNIELKLSDEEPKSERAGAKKCFAQVEDDDGDQEDESDSKENNKEENDEIDD